MSNSAAHPVLRTTDVTEAHAAGLRLRALLARCDDEVDIYVEMIRTVPEARTMAEALPGVTFEWAKSRTDPQTGEWLWLDGLEVMGMDDATLETHLPLKILDDAPRQGVDDRFAAPLPGVMTNLSWRGRWPDDDPAAEQDGTVWDGVQVLFHGDLAQWGDTTPHHTVFVHVHPLGDLPRAQKLAACIGSKVLGKKQSGW